LFFMIYDFCFVGPKCNLLILFTFFFVL